MKKNSKIGLMKDDVLSTISHYYALGDKKSLKKVIKLLKENADYKTLYLMYEDLESKYFEDKTDAELFVEEFLPMLSQKYVKALPFIYKLSENINKWTGNKTPLYESLDILLERRTLENVDKKIKAKKDLIKHLTTKKEPINESANKVTYNENLFYSILTNNFNVLYSNTLTEEEQNELKKFIALSNDDVKEQVDNLREEILNKVEKLINESIDEELTDKLEIVQEEVYEIKPTKYNLYKLQELKNGL